MYSPRAILGKQPVAIAAAARSVLYVLVLAGVLHWDAMLLAGVALAAEGVLGLFAWSTSVPVSSAQAAAADAYDQGAADARTAAAGGQGG